MNNLLDGKTFTRTVISEGWFGQPEGEMDHDISFHDGCMTDTSGCFFGNPPETKLYELRGSDIFMKNDNSDWVKSEYTFQDGIIIYNGTSKMVQNPHI